MKIIKAGVTAKQSATPLQSKNAGPPAGATALEEVFDGVQPQCVVLQRTLGTAVKANEPMVAALERQCELHVSPGNKFLEQWRPQYLSDIICFDFPRGTGGTEFTNVERLRVLGAPEVNLGTYTRGLPRRIERHIRASWILAPALRNLSSDGRFWNLQI